MCRGCLLQDHYTSDSTWQCHIPGSPKASVYGTNVILSGLLEIYLKLIVYFH